RFRNGFAGDFLFQFQALELAHPAIIPEEDGARVIPVSENSCDQRLEAIRRLDQALNHETIAVAVDDEAGQEIAFGIDPPAQQRMRSAPRLRITIWPVSITDSLHAYFRFRLPAPQPADRARAGAAARLLAHDGAGPQDRGLDRFPVPRVAGIFTAVGRARP